MNTSKTTGLGDPEPVGKAALFRPPERSKQKQRKTKSKGQHTAKEKPPRRVRTTLSITRKALAIIQQMQNRHRLKTGRALEMWRAVSEAIEFYGKQKGIKTD